MLTSQNVRLSKCVVYVLGIVLAVLVTGCGNPLLQDDASSPGAFGPRPARIQLTDAEFTLVWDAADEDVTEYRIYIRQHQGSEWTLLADGLSEPSLTVDASVMTAGSYDFAVSYVCLEGNESVKHTSLDATADPQIGWYLSWEPEDGDG